MQNNSALFESLKGLDEEIDAAVAKGEAKLEELVGEPLEHQRCLLVDLDVVKHAAKDLEEEILLFESMEDERFDLFLVKIEELRMAFKESMPG